MLELQEEPTNELGLEPIHSDDAFLWWYDSLSESELAQDFLKHNKSLPYSLCQAGYWHLRQQEPKARLLSFLGCDNKHDTLKKLEHFPDAKAIKTAINEAEKVNLIELLDAPNNDKKSCVKMYDLAIESNHPIIQYWVSARLQRADFLDRASHLLMKVIMSKPQHLSRLAECGIANLIFLGTENNYAKTVIAQLILSDGIKHRKHAKHIERFLSVYCLTQDKFTTARNLLMNACMNTSHPDINALYELTDLYYQRNFNPCDEPEKTLDENLLLITQLLYQRYVTKGDDCDGWRDPPRTREKLADWLIKIYTAYPNAPIVNYHVAQLHLVRQEYDLAYERMSKSLSLYIPPKITTEFAVTLMSSARTMKEQDRLEPQFERLLLKALENGGTEAGLKLAEHYGNRQFYKRLSVLSRTFKIAYIIGDANAYNRIKTQLEAAIHFAALTINPTDRLVAICEMYDVQLSVNPSNAADCIRDESIYFDGQRNLKLFNCFEQDGKLETLDNIERALIAQQSLNDLSNLWTENQYDAQYAPEIKDKSANEKSTMSKTFECLSVLIDDDFRAIAVYRQQPSIFLLTFSSDPDEFSPFINRNNLLALALSLKKHPDHRTAEFRKRIAEGVTISRLMHYCAMANRKSFSGEIESPEVRYLFDILMTPEIINLMPESIHRDHLITGVKTYYYLLYMPENFMTELTKLKRGKSQAASDLFSGAMKQLFVLNSVQSNVLHEASRNARNISPSSSRHKTTTIEARSTEDSKYSQLSKVCHSLLSSPRNLQPRKTNSKEPSPRSLLNRTESAPANLSSLGDTLQRSSPIYSKQDATQKNEHLDSYDGDDAANIPPKQTKN